MPVPDDETLKRELLQFLAGEPDHKATVWRVYEQLALMHPELTDSEKNDKYRNSASLWANRVQFARLHLANSGLLHRANAIPAAPRSVWMLTQRGVERAAKFALSRRSETVPKELLADAAADIDSALAENALPEGGRQERLVAYYERNPQLRAAAVQIHGTSCLACGFDFRATYGARGVGYIEVHHLVPVASMHEPTSINPATDMTVLCANCHRMVHRRMNEPLSMAQLKALLEKSPR